MGICTPDLCMWISHPGESHDELNQAAHTGNVCVCNATPSQSRPPGIMPHPTPGLRGSAPGGRQCTSHQCTSHPVTTPFHTQGTRPQALSQCRLWPRQPATLMVWKLVARETSVSKALVGELA